MEAIHTIEDSPVLLEEPLRLSPSREECGVAISVLYQRSTGGVGQDHARQHLLSQHCTRTSFSIHFYIHVFLSVAPNIDRYWFIFSARLIEKS